MTSKQEIVHVAIAPVLVL